MAEPKVIQIIKGKKGTKEEVQASQPKESNRQRGQVTCNEGEKLYR